MKIEWESLPIYTLSPCGPTKKFFHMKKKKKKLKAERGTYASQLIFINYLFMQIIMYVNYTAS